LLRLNGRARNSAWLLIARSIEKHDYGSGFQLRCQLWCELMALDDLRCAGRELLFEKRCRAPADGVVLAQWVAVADD
jgi:hypothetical protein